MKALKEARAEAAKVPRNVERVLQHGNMIRFFCETDTFYTGPYPVERVDGSQVFITVKGKEVQHNLDQIMPVADYGQFVIGDASIVTLFNVTKQFRSEKPKVKSSDIFIAALSHPLDPRGHTSEASASNLKEIEALV